MMEAEAILRSGNNQLAKKLQILIHDTVDRALDMSKEAETPNDLYTIIKIAETAGKITGIVQDKQVINMQINNISGFTFIEVDKEKIIQEQRANAELAEVIS